MASKQIQIQSHLQNHAENNEDHLERFTMKNLGSGLNVHALGLQAKFSLNIFLIFLHNTISQFFVC